MMSNSEKGGAMHSSWQSFASLISPKKAFYYCFRPKGGIWFLLQYCAKTIRNIIINSYYNLTGKAIDTASEQHPSSAQALAQHHSPCATTWKQHRYSNLWFATSATLADKRWWGAYAQEQEVGPRRCGRCIGRYRTFQDDQRGGKQRAKP